MIRSNNKKNRPDRNAEYERKFAAGEIVKIDGIPVHVGPRGDPAQRQRKAIRKQLKRMANSDDPWTRKKATKWAWLARQRRVVPFWKRAMWDVNSHGNVYHGLFAKGKKGWKGIVAEFPSIVATEKALRLASISLAAKLKAHCRLVDGQCEANLNAGGVIVGLRPDGRTAIWIGQQSKLK
jgi:hypothetical protein